VELKKYTEANREAWNEVTPVHEKNRKINLREEFKKPGFSTLDQTITGLLMEIGLEGKKVAQVCCNNGRELLSLINLGAKEGVGFDISDEALKIAEELKQISGLNVEFVRTDIYDLDNKYDKDFDLVYISVGALAWMPDLNKFFGKSISLLKPGGDIVIYEGHPFIYMLAMEDEEGYDPDNLYKIAYSYFRTEPWVNDSGIDYIGKTKYKSKINYNFTYKISDCINALINNGIEIKGLNEYSHDIGEEFDYLEKDKLIPLSYVLIGRRR